MDKRLIPGPKEWPYGYNAINSWKDEDPKTMMDFGILRQKAAAELVENAIVTEEAPAEGDGGE